MSATPEMRHCKKHGAYPVISVPTAARRADGERFTFRLEHCRECANDEAVKKSIDDAATEALERQARIEKRFSTSGIPRGFADRTFESYLAELPGQVAALAKCKAFSNSFLKHFERGTMLLMLGNIGTGKTHLAIAIAQLAMARGHSCMYETAFELVSRMRDCMRRDAAIGTAEMLRTYGTVDLLIIDEFGIQAATDDVRAHLTNVIDQRYRNARPTIMITNLDKVELADYVGERVADRMRERASVIPFDWESQRAAVRQRGEF